MGYKAKGKIFFLLIALLIAILIGLNKTSSRLIGINYQVTEYEIPLYLKLYDFYGRHLNYEYLVSKITKNINGDEDKVINLSKWVNKNIQKIPQEIEIIDSHPITILERRLGVREQFSDLLSVLIVYAGIDSFFWRNNNDELKSALTYFNLNGEWSLVDPYYGIIFLNLQGELATISELKKSNWEIYSLEMESININNFKFYFNNNFDSIDQIKEYYAKQFYEAPSQEIISLTNKFDLGGRSYVQSPLGRLKFIFYGMWGNLSN